MGIHDSKDCKCAKCAAVSAGLTIDEANAAQVEWENKALAEHGFYVHYVAEDSDSPTNFNAHTHGMQNFGDHLDFQIVIPLPTKVAHSIISEIARRVKKGERFSSGQNVDNIITNFQVKLIDAYETDRKVLRIIFPGPDGKLEPNEITGNYRLQYKDIEIVELLEKSWIPYKP